MFFYAANQGAVILSFALCGALISALLCLCAALRRRFGSALFSVLSQLALAALCLALMLSAVIITNQGSLRLYMLIGMACGALMFIFGIFLPVRSFLLKLGAKRRGRGDKAVLS